VSELEVKTQSYKKNLLIEKSAGLTLIQQIHKKSTKITRNYFFLGATGGGGFLGLRSLSKFVCKFLTAGIEFNVTGGGRALGTTKGPTELLKTD